MAVAKASQQLDFVASKDLEQVLSSAQVPSYAEKLFRGLAALLRTPAAASAWPALGAEFRAAQLVLELQSFQPQGDEERVKEALQELCTVSPKCMKVYSTACTLLLEWCHALSASLGGAVCGDASAEEVAAARAEAQEIRAAAPAAEKKAAPEKAAPKAEEPGQLVLRSMVSGEVVATIGANPKWTCNDVRARLLTVLDKMGQVHFFKADQKLDNYKTLAAQEVDTENGELSFSFVDWLQVDLNEEGIPPEQLEANLQALATELNVLDAASIQELKCFARPPMLVQLAAEAVAVLLGRSCKSWPDCAKMMNPPWDFLKELKEFNKDEIPESRLMEVEWYVHHPELTAENVSRVSRAATVFVVWVHGVYKYGMAKAQAQRRAATK
ncbi:unnamed protein product [Effrenium voratum]|nr:unnamed protein product [Effrenium voratum]